MPGYPPKIDRHKLQDMIRAKVSQVYCAKHFGVTQSAVSRAVKQLKLETAKNVSLERINDVTSKNLDTISQLYKINQTTQKLLDELTGEEKTIDRMVKAIEGAIAYQDDPQTQREYIRQVTLQVNQDKNTALKACAEIRGQLKLQLDIYQMLYDMRAVQEFQAEVLETINSISPETKERIVNGLLRKRAIRAAVQMDVPPGYQPREE